MDCREFDKHLPDYLQGDASEPLFGELVEHEAACPRCREAAANESLEPTAIQAVDTVREPALHAVMERTAGRDCSYIEYRMSEALEDPLPDEISRLVGEHVADCPSCQRMRDMLQALPSFYEELPILYATPEFTKGVLARTSGPQPSFLDVIRAIWRKPEAIWEAAAACALIVLLLFGSRLPTFDEFKGQLGQVPLVGNALQIFDSSETGESNTFGPVAEGYGAVKSSWIRVETWAVGASAWAERMGEDIRTGDLAGLLAGMKLVLEPVGLYPSSEEEAGTSEDGVPAESDGQGSPSPEGDEK